jgi:Zn-finger protein
MKSFIGWLKTQDTLAEADTRYSVEVNFRTKIDEVMKNAAKITLGYASAALKKAEFHVRQVFEEDPLRILVSTRNWDDGEWVCLVSWNPEHKCFVISKGFYNKDRKSVSVQGSKHCNAENASEIANEVKNMMHSLKDKPDRHVEKLKKAPLKRGPK